MLVTKYHFYSKQNFLNEIQAFGHNFTRPIHTSIRKRMPGCAYVEHRAIGSRRAAHAAHAAPPIPRLTPRRAAPRLSVAVSGLTRLSGPNEIDSFQSWRHCQDFMLGAPPKQMRPIFTVVDIKELGVTWGINLYL
jgi:hypothetical protein